jgi:hypothetical protein
MIIRGRSIINKDRGRVVEAQLSSASDDWS